MASKKNQASAKTTETVAKKGAKPAVSVPDDERRYRLKKRYETEILPQLVKELGLVNIYQAPRLEKIVINMRLGDIKDNSKSINLAVAELTAIAGQKAVTTAAKKSVSNFKVREGQIIGAKVTLRGKRMYEFFDRLISIALPRVRDFRGVSDRSFDGRGNYSLGIKEQIMFPEVSYDTIEKIRGFDICVVTTAANDADAKLLLSKLGMPFKRQG